jgi:signal transduction histidine kinase
MWATLLPVTLLGFTVILVSIYSIHRITVDLVIGRSMTTTQIAASNIAEDIESYKHLLQSVAARVAKSPSTPSEQQTVLEEMSGCLLPFQAGVILLDSQGVAIANSPGYEARSGINYSLREYFQEVQRTGEPQVSNVLKEKLTGRDVVAIALPVPSDSAPAPVLAGGFFLDEQAWPETLGLMQTPEGGETFLVDRYGTIISHPDSSEIGKVVPQDSCIAQLVAGGIVDSTITRSKLNGRRTVIAYAPIPGTNWGVVNSELWASLLNPAIPYIVIVFGLITIGIGLTIIILLGNIERVSRPLVDLARETDRFSLGKPFQPLQVDGPLEVRTVIGAVNRMVARLLDQQSRLRQYAIQVVRSQEDERKRISRDLHDDTVQKLVGLVQRLELCNRELRDRPEDVAQRLQELNQIAQSTLAEVRRMSNDLRPFILEDLGLPAALQAMAEQLADQMPKTNIHYEIVGHERQLPPEMELTAFRITQEALNNARKHASAAAHVTVTLFFERWGILITVEDDGPGFSMPDTQSLMRSQHLGLAGMMERAQLFGGSLSIATTHGAGTSVSLQLITETQPNEHANASQASGLALSD